MKKLGVLILIWPHLARHSTGRVWPSKNEHALNFILRFAFWFLTLCYPKTFRGAKFTLATLWKEGIKIPNYISFGDIDQKIF